MIKLDNENIKDIEYYSMSKNTKIYNYKLLFGILKDLDEINDTLVNEGQPNKTFHIEYENEHTEYSPERVDPCPDYFGMFCLVADNDPTTIIGEPLTIDELNQNMMTLFDFINIV